MLPCYNYNNRRLLLVRGTGLDRPALCRGRSFCRGCSIRTAVQSLRILELLRPSLLRLNIKSATRHDSTRQTAFLYRHARTGSAYNAVVAGKRIICVEWPVSWHADRTLRHGCRKIKGKAANVRFLSHGSKSGNRAGARNEKEDNTGAPSVTPVGQIVSFC